MKPHTHTQTYIHTDFYSPELKHSQFNEATHTHTDTHTHTHFYSPELKYSQFNEAREASVNRFDLVEQHKY